MKKLSVILLLAISMGSCSTYQKALKSEDSELQAKIGDEMFEAGKYKKAIKLYDLILKRDGMKPNLRSVVFNDAKANYILRRYEISAPFLKRFNLTYPVGEHVQEASYLEAMSLYNMSEVYSLDQHITYDAIAKFDEYIEKYPDSEFVEQARLFKKELVEKLEKKAYEAAKQYNTIGEYTRDYTAAMVALDNFMLDYPGSVYKEDALFYKFDSAYKLAINSVYSKMNDRIQTAMKAYEALLNYNGNTKYKEKADKMLTRLEKESKQFSNI